MVKRWPTLPKKRCVCLSREIKLPKALGVNVCFWLLTVGRSTLLGKLELLFAGTALSGFPRWPSRGVFVAASPPGEAGASLPSGRRMETQQRQAGAGLSWAKRQPSWSWLFLPCAVELHWDDSINNNEVTSWSNPDAGLSAGRRHTATRRPGFPCKSHAIPWQSPLPSRLARGRPLSRVLPP